MVSEMFKVTNSDTKKVLGNKNGKVKLLYILSL